VELDPNPPSSGAEPPGEPPGAAVQRQYVVAVDVLTDDSRTGYVTSVPSLDAGTVANLDSAIEFTGGVNIFGRPERGTFYAAPFEEPVIEKWSVGADGRFERSDRVSFTNLGVASASNVAYTPLYSDTKSYFTSATDLVIWNPTAMTLVEVRPVPEEYLQYGAEGPFAVYSVEVLLVRDDLVQLAVIFMDPDEWGHWGEHMKVINFDPRTDTFMGAVDETRCEWVAARGRKTSDGKTYFSTDPSFEFLARAYGDEYGTRSCGLRVVDPGQSFDAGFDVNLSELVGGRPAGLVTPVSDDLAYISVYHTELLGTDITAETYDSIWASDAPRAFRLWTWHIGDPVANDDVEQEPSAYGIGGEAQIVVDDRVFSVDISPDFASWRLLELKPDGTLSPALSGPNRAALGVVRVR
ncbi:MAG TPA: hypothetical protein VMG12_31680, partial [Polyangiaceae bacterium]|nr:hypothetical protein [Polyangiaceae bacterium]